jgi:hypothetical protein
MPTEVFLPHIQQGLSYAAGAGITAYENPFTPPTTFFVDRYLELRTPAGLSRRSICDFQYAIATEMRLLDILGVLTQSGALP